MYGNTDTILCVYLNFFYHSVYNTVLMLMLLLKSIQFNSIQFNIADDRPQTIASHFVRQRRPVTARDGTETGTHAEAARGETTRKDCLSVV